MNFISNHKCVCKECELKSIRKVFVGKGLKTEYRLYNERRISVDKFVVDVCLLKERQKDEKCDYLFKINETKQALFIECKGSDVLKAIRQLGSSINTLQAELNGFTFKGRIIPTKVHSPDLRAVEYKRLRGKLVGELVIRNIFFEESI